MKGASIMSEKKAATTKRTPKQAEAVTETGKSGKAARSPEATRVAPAKPGGRKNPSDASSSAKAGGKTSAATKAATTTPGDAATKSKRVPKQTAAATETAKPAGRSRAADAPPSAKAASKAPRARKAATTKPEDTTTTPAAARRIKKPAAPSHQERQRWIAIAAYHRAEKRGFAPGYEMQDWLDAEAEISDLIGES
ncbi:MAG: DUF2934 domain-containing protein [Hyphomicrobiaceae bacterium]